jgi:hypothetical protein
MITKQSLMRVLGTGLTVMLIVCAIIVVVTVTAAWQWLTQ